jgi:hypothetical protein
MGYSDEGKDVVKPAEKSLSMGFIQGVVEKPSF